MLGSFCCIVQAAARDLNCRLLALGLQARIRAIKWMEENDQLAWNLFVVVINSDGFVVDVVVVVVVVDDVVVMMLS